MCVCAHGGRLLQRYQNVKSELEAQQNLERIRAEKMAQAGLLATAAPNTVHSSASVAGRQVCGCVCARRWRDSGGLCGLGDCVMT